MNTAEKEAVTFAKWLWHNHICYYGGEAAQWLGHMDSKPYTTEELYQKWSNLAQTQELQQDRV